MGHKNRKAGETIKQDTNGSMEIFSQTSNMRMIRSGPIRRAEHQEYSGSKRVGHKGTETKKPRSKAALLLTLSSVVIFTAAVWMWIFQEPSTEKPSSEIEGEGIYHPQTEIIDQLEKKIMHLEKKIIRQRTTIGNLENGYSVTYALIGGKDIQLYNSKLQLDVNYTIDGNIRESTKALAEKIIFFNDKHGIQIFSMINYTISTFEEKIKKITGLKVFGEEYQYLAVGTQDYIFIYNISDQNRIGSVKIYKEQKLINIFRLGNNVLGLEIAKKNDKSLKIVKYSKEIDEWGINESKNFQDAGTLEILVTKEYVIRIGKNNHEIKFDELSSFNYLDNVEGPNNTTAAILLDDGRYMLGTSEGEIIVRRVLKQFDETIDPKSVVQKGKKILNFVLTPDPILVLVIVEESQIIYSFNLHTYKVLQYKILKDLPQGRLIAVRK